MSGRDRELGMARKISRRDFLHGAVGSLVAGAALSPGCSPSQAPGSAGPPGSPGRPPGAAGYPPSRLGLRGSHPGSFEVAHRMAFEGRGDWGAATAPDADLYDLVVVGAGVSGLAAAVFYREQNPGARVLLLENHDDFGGHAKRNEFAWNGRTILGYGGSQSLEAPSAYSEIANGLLERIGVVPERLREAYDADFFRRHDLAGGVYFDAGSYGRDRVVRSDFIDPSLFLPVATSGVSAEQGIGQMPISEAARTELHRIAIAESLDRLPDHSIFEEPGYLMTISYREFLTRHLGVREPEVIELLNGVTGSYFGHGIDVVPAAIGLGFGLPGMRSTSLGSFEGLIRRGIAMTAEPYQFHFPDGNASVARLLVQRLVPEVAEITGMEEAIGADFDYAALDRPGSEVRLRLGSTVVRALHDGDVRSADRVALTYVRDGRTEQVRGRRVVMACYNAVVPHLCPELPDPQKEALRAAVKTPLVYTNVLLRSWQAFERLGLAFAYCPGTWHQMAMLDFPVSLGDYRFTGSPDEPIVLHMNRTWSKPGLTPQEQSRLGRYELLQMPFEAIEREVRTHLSGMLGEGGFDAGRDIEALVVNRWPHGYAHTPNPLFDPKTEPGQAPHEIGRRRFGRIAIANSDAGARAYLDEAIDQAWRAVGDLQG